MTVWNKRLLAPHAPVLRPIAAKYLEELRSQIESGRIELIEVSKCFCESEDLSVLASTDRFGLPFASLLCEKCGLVLTSPVFSEKSLQYYYERYYHPINYNTENLTLLHSLFRKGQGAAIYKRLPTIDKAEIDVLEIGAGTGSVLSEFADMAAKRGIKVKAVGTEFNEACLDLMSQQGISAIRGGCPEVSASGRKFDVILLSHVLEHVVDISTFLGQLRELGKEEALVYAEVPGLLSLHVKPEYSGDLLEFLIHAHVYAFDLRSLEFVFAKSGFRMLSGSEIAHGVFVPGEEPAPDVSGNAQYLKTYLAAIEATFAESTSLWNDWRTAVNAKARLDALRFKGFDWKGHPPRLLGTDLVKEFRDALRELKRRLNPISGEKALLVGGDQTGELLAALLSQAGIPDPDVIKPSAVIEGAPATDLPVVISPEASSSLELSWTSPGRIVQTGELARGERHFDEFRNVHSMRRCFILGSDRSLEGVDLSPLAGEITIGSTLILDRLKEQGLQLSYWIVENAIYARDSREKWDNLTGPVKFLPRDLKYLATNLEGVALFDLLRHPFGPLGPSFNPLAPAFFSGGFVTYLELQLAIYLGCDRIYLLGADYYFPRPRDAGPLDFAPIRAGLANALNYARSVGASIEVAIPAQALEIFPKVEYRSLFTHPQCD